MALLMPKKRLSALLLKKKGMIQLHLNQVKASFMFVNRISIDIAKKILLPLYYQFVIRKGRLFRVYQNHRNCQYWRLVTTKSPRTLTL